MTPTFGDDAARRTTTITLYKVVGRAFICIPLGTVGVALCVSVIGLPLGIPLMLVLGKWIARPLQQHPNFKIPSPSEQRQAARTEYDVADEYESYEDWLNN